MDANTENAKTVQSFNCETVIIKNQCGNCCKLLEQQVRFLQEKLKKAEDQQQQVRFLHEKLKKAEEHISKLNGQLRRHSTFSSTETTSNMYENDLGRPAQNVHRTFGPEANIRGPQSDSEDVPYVKQIETDYYDETNVKQIAIDIYEESIAIDESSDGPYDLDDLYDYCKSDPGSITGSNKGYISQAETQEKDLETDIPVNMGMGSGQDKERQITSRLHCPPLPPRKPVRTRGLPPLPTYTPIKSLDSRRPPPPPPPIKPAKTRGLPHTCEETKDQETQKVQNNTVTYRPMKVPKEQMRQNHPHTYLTASEFEKQRNGKMLQKDVNKQYDSYVMTVSNGKVYNV